jgi:hypothetical protein
MERRTVKPSISDLGADAMIGQKNILLPSGVVTGGNFSADSPIRKVRVRYKGKKQEEKEQAEKPSFAVLFYRLTGAGHGNTPD